MTQFGVVGSHISAVMGTIGLTGITTPQALHAALSQPAPIVSAVDAYFGANDPEIPGFTDGYQASDGYSAAKLFGHLLWSSTPEDARRTFFWPGQRMLNAHEPSETSNLNTPYFDYLARTLGTEIPIIDVPGEGPLFVRHNLREPVFDNTEITGDIAREAAKYVFLRVPGDGRLALMYGKEDHSHFHMIRACNSRHEEKVHLLGAGWLRIVSGILAIDGNSAGFPTTDEYVGGHKGELENLNASVPEDAGLDTVTRLSALIFADHPVLRLLDIANLVGEFKSIPDLHTALKLAPFMRYALTRGPDEKPHFYYSDREGSLRYLEYIEKHTIISAGQFSIRDGELLVTAMKDTGELQEIVGASLPVKIEQ